MSDVLSKVRQAVRRHQMVSAGEAAVVAVSGGCDSVVLLDLLDRLARPNGWRLVVAHFNHQLRGRASDADERFVRRAALRLELPFVGGQGDVRAYARQEKVSIEMAARALRHAFLARTARDIVAAKVFLAHHADDQVETFLLQLIRGAGTDGLAGMAFAAPSPADAGVTLLRPLLDATRAELSDYARRRQLRFRQDASNARVDLPRNFVRRRLLPLLARHLQPAIVGTLRRVMAVVGDEGDLVDRLARRWLAGGRRTCFDAVPVAVQRRILVHALRRLGLEPRFDWIEKLRLYPGRTVTVSPGRRVSRDEGGDLRTTTTVTAPVTARRSPSHLADCVLRAPGGQQEFDGVQFRWRIRAGGLPRRATIESQAGIERFDADRVGRRITLRHWTPGDRFQPIGLGGPTKLQDLFTNAKVPRAERHRRVVGVTEAGEVFWVEGLRIGDRFKLTKNTRRMLVWRWRRPEAGLARVG